MSVFFILGICDPLHFFPKLKACHPFELTIEDKRVVLGAIKGGISSIPFIGGALVGAWDSYHNGRLQDFVNELSEKVKRLGEDKFDKEFVASEEYQDLFYKGFQISMGGRCKKKAAFIFGTLIESAMIARDFNLSSSLKESFLKILDQLTDDELVFLRDFYHEKYVSKSRTNLEELGDPKLELALDGVLASGLIKENDTWEKHLVWSRKGKELINYAKSLTEKTIIDGFLFE